MRTTTKTPAQRLLLPTWRTMIYRCHRPQATGFERYGARGIQVCERWRTSLAAFVDDMGPKPSAEHTIDRINNDGNYEPSNCRWATRQQQAANRRVAPGGMQSFGSTNAHSKLTESAVIEIRRAYAAAESSQSQLAARFGVTRSAVSRVVHRIHWPHV